jgi:hypothetical protein
MNSGWEQIMQERLRFYGHRNRLVLACLDMKASCLTLSRRCRDACRAYD